MNQTKMTTTKRSLLLKTHLNSNRNLSATWTNLLKGLKGKPPSGKHRVKCSGQPWGQALVTTSQAEEVALNRMQSNNNQLNSMMIGLNVNIVIESSMKQRLRGIFLNVRKSIRQTWWKQREVQLQGRLVPHKPDSINNRGAHQLGSRNEYLNV